MVQTINNMCLAAGPGPGGVFLTLRGKCLGALETSILVGE